MNLNAVLDWQLGLVNSQLQWLDVTISFMLTVSFLTLFACGALIQLFPDNFDLQKLNAMLNVIYCPPDYSLIILSNVFVF